MKNNGMLYERIDQLKLNAKLGAARVALLRCKHYARVFKEEAHPISKAGFEDIEKIATEAQKTID
tara:strand:+ start:390 stop:584 length:195 start_codon:yes stop_codon:yes gene_type:complete